MPTVFLWIAKHDEFSKQYARAQADRVVAWSEEIVEIADNSKAETNRVKLRVDTRRWLMSKMDPKKYGDRQEHRHTGPTGGPIQTVDITKLKGMTNEELELLERALVQIGIVDGDPAGEGEPEE